MCRRFLVFLHIMKIILIGAGNLATHLGKALRHVGIEIPQVFSRTMESASVLAHIVGAEPVVDITELRDDADVYLLSIKDSVLSSLATRLALDKENGRNKKKKIFLHTAGSMPMSIFEGKVERYGVLYPMQSFSKQKEVDFSEIPCFVEGSDEQTLGQIEELALMLSRKVYRLNSADRKYLHLSAVFACNFVNHCYAISQDILERCGLPFDVMLPLVEETAAKVHSVKPLDAQTGPAVRYDENVIGAQSRLLEQYPEWQVIYDKMSEDIHRMACGVDKRNDYD